MQWRNIDQEFPKFGDECRNIRFGLAIDGMNPFGNLSKNHNCWCNIPSAPRPEHVRLLQPDAPQPITLLRPFILGGLLPVEIEPPT